MYGFEFYDYTFKLKSLYQGSKNKVLDKNIKQKLKI